MSKTGTNPAQILCERALCDLATAPPLDEPASDHLGFLQTFEIRITCAPYTDHGTDPAGDCLTDYTGTLADALQRCARHHYGQSVDLKFAIEEVERIWYRDYR